MTTFVHKYRTPLTKSQELRKLVVVLNLLKLISFYKFTLQEGELAYASIIVFLTSCRKEKEKKDVT
jgi:hypothetical protein